jgi:hypothetical protein
MQYVQRRLHPPGGVTLGISLVLPHGESTLEFLDHEPGRLVRVDPVRCGDSDDDGNVTEIEVPDAVVRADRTDIELPRRLVADGPQLLLGHRPVGFVPERCDLPAVVRLADASLKDEHGAVGVLGQIVERGKPVDRVRGYRRLDEGRSTHGGCRAAHEDVLPPGDRRDQRDLISVTERGACLRVALVHGYDDPLGQPVESANPAEDLDQIEHGAPGRELRRPLSFGGELSVHAEEQCADADRISHRP